MNKTLFIVILLLGAYIIFSGFFQPGTFPDRISLKIGLISQILFAVGIYLTYLDYSQSNLEQRRINTIKITNVWLGINSKIRVLYPRCPNFCNSLYFDFQRKALGKEISGEDDWTAVLDLSNSIIQTIENVLEFTESDNSGFYSWLTVFITWGNSKILRKAFEAQKELYRVRTQLFIRAIFEFEDRYQIKNGDDLMKVAGDFCKSKELKEIIPDIDYGCDPY
jgi:hypothetical protein